jgi:precorrin-2 dehydrogenase / sirohydrochlorin ferrochelatase
MHHVIALEAAEAVHEWAKAGKITLELRAFAPGDLDGAFLAVVATASPALNESIYREAQRRGVLCNVVDVPEFCDFYYPAVVRRGDLQIAISTSGQSPSLAQKTSATAGTAVWSRIRPMGRGTGSDAKACIGQRSRSATQT